MKINNEQLIAADSDEVWDLLTDVPRVARCLPGAEVTKQLGETSYEGVVSLKVGPLSLKYGGVLEIIEQDDTERVVYLRGRGRDHKGAGSVGATVRVSLRPEGSETLLLVASDLELSGKLAMLGRGIPQVASQILRGFAANVRDEVQRSS